MKLLLIALVASAGLVGAACRTTVPEGEGDSSGDRPALGAPEGPPGRSFWRVPLEAPAGSRRGEVLWAAERSDAPAGARGWNIIYVSEGATGALVYVSGEVYMPDAPAQAATRPLVVWNHGTAGTQDSCAPSRNDLVVETREGDRLATDGNSRVPALVSLLP